jgi:hypothetical protein
MSTLTPEEEYREARIASREALMKLEEAEKAMHEASRNLALAIRADEAARRRVSACAVASLNARFAALS